MQTKAILGAGASATLAITLLAYSETLQYEWGLLMAPFGASAVLLFGLPDSPLAQPKNVIAGHFLTALIGVLFIEFLPLNPLTLGLATGLAVSAMLLTQTTHPPAGANPMVVMLSGQSWEFLLTPVLLGAISLVLLGWGYRRLGAKPEGL